MVRPTFVSLQVYSPRRSDVSITSWSQKPSPTHKHNRRAVYTIHAECTIHLLDMSNGSAPIWRLSSSLLLKELSCRWVKSVSVDSWGTFTILHSTRVILLAMSSVRLYKVSQALINIHKAHTPIYSTHIDIYWQQSVQYIYCTTVVLRISRERDGLQARLHICRAENSINHPFPYKMSSSIYRQL